MVDDMIDTGGTLCKAAEALKERGAKTRIRLRHAPDLLRQRHPEHQNSVIDEFVVCDTIPLTPEIKALEKVRTLTLSGMLAEAIRRISNEESISAMFEH
ncbi:ribose-phosphate pyrophosphokinase [Klebsiella michiganensis]|nr:ribose-phosphate pyrophosphokinase [Klebsiella michiganensis]